MSIIYDALRKIDESNSIISSTKINRKMNKSNLKIYLLYACVACAGFFIAGIFWRFLAKSLPANNTPIAEQNLASQETTVAEPKVDVKPAFTLNGVFFSQNEGYALINNQIVKEGDVISGAIVKRIILDEVELEYAGAVIKLPTKR